MNASKLRERCREFLLGIDEKDLFANREGDDTETADELAAFVMSEIGRAADERFEDSAPLVLFFHNRSDAQELVDAIMEAKPGMLSRKWP